jgi:hypothetical protein
MSFLLPSLLKFYFAFLNFIHHSDDFDLFKTMFKLSILLQFLIFEHFEVGIPLTAPCFAVRSLLYPLFYQGIRLFYCTFDNARIRIFEHFHFVEI